MQFITIIIIFLQTFTLIKKQQRYEIILVVHLLVNFIIFCCFKVLVHFLCLNMHFI